MADKLNAPVATRYTHDFVRGSLREDAAAILEIGCGAGELAAGLMRDGFRLVALDASEECVRTASAVGVDARVGSWPVEVGEGFDAILFTRSLHHIHDLDDAIRSAVRALNPGGRIIVEDFRSEGAGAKSGGWFLGLGRRLLESGELAGVTFEELSGKLETGEDHHPLHRSQAIEDSLSRELAVRAWDAAYYFRYLEPYLGGRDAAEALLRHELALIASGSIDPLGRRFVASL